MSLFASLGQGDIWSISGIAFGSPINDILDKEVYTLEELLEEDELLQELKARNARLIDFLILEDSIEKLLDYTIIPPNEGDSELRTFKYPYMSCEVLCMEVPEILQMLVHYSDGKFMAKLLSFLDQQGALNNHLAGYFEKILEMLFRKETESIITYLNNGDVELFCKFLDHIDNYSIMQIVQRLMLPHIPFSMTADSDGALVDDGLTTQCKWSFSEEFCKLLCNRMVMEGHIDVPSHISDLLITVVQLSPPDSLVILNLCEVECLDRLIVAAICRDTDIATLESPNSLRGCVSLSCISVLESLISRLSESLAPLEEGDQQTMTKEDHARIFKISKSCIERVCMVLKVYFPDLYSQLNQYLDHESLPSSEMLTQSKIKFPRLGHRGLQLVKLIEAVVRFGEEDVDMLLCSSGVFSVAIELMFHFPLNSLLHLSVQRIIVTIIEGGEAKRSCQHHILVELGLLNRIIDFLMFDPFSKPRPPRPICRSMSLATSSGDSGDDDGKQPEKKEFTISPQDAEKMIAGSPHPLRGHLLLIAQAVQNALAAEEELKLDSSFSSASALGSSTFESTPQTDISPTNVGESMASDKQASPLEDSFRAADAAKVTNMNTLHQIIRGSNLVDKWRDFSSVVMKKYMDRQTGAQYEGEGSLDVKPNHEILLNLSGKKENNDSEMLFQQSYGWNVMHSNEEEDDEDDVEAYDDKIQNAQFSNFADFSNHDLHGFQSSGNSIEGFADFASFGVQMDSNPLSPIVDDPFASTPDTTAVFEADFADFSAMDLIQGEGGLNQVDNPKDDSTASEQGHETI